MAEKSHRIRRRTINQLGADWAEIGARMIEADRENSGRVSSSRLAIAAEAGLSVAVARKIFRMAGDLEVLRARDLQMAKAVKSCSIAPAEIILRWSRDDMRGARAASREFQAGRHTIASLLIAERDARIAGRSGAGFNAQREIEQRVFNTLMHDPRFNGWTIKRVGSERDIAAACLPPELLLAGVDAIAEPHSPGMRRRLVMIYQSTLDRPDAQFLRHLKTAVWTATGVAAHTGLEVWVVAAAAIEYPAFNALVNFLSSERTQLTGVQILLTELGADSIEAI
jgi:hypothetical protein